MFDHVGFGVTNLPESKAFFLRALEPIGVSVVMEGPYGVGMGRNAKPSLWLYESVSKPAPLHIAFSADIEAKSTPSTKQPVPQEARTTGCLDFDRTIMRITTVRL